MKNAIHCSNCPNKNCFIKQNCSGSWLEKLSRSKYYSVQKKEQHIFLEGNPVFGIYFIKQGKVKVTARGNQNKEQIVRLAKDGYILGHRGFGGDLYPVSAIAMEDTSVCFFENEILYSAFMENPKLTYALMMFYSAELRKSEMRMKRLAQMSVREKTADALLLIKDVFGLENETKALNVSFNREDISGIAGISYGQAIRDLSSFKKEKIIAFKGKKIQILDEVALAEIVAYHY